MSDVVLEVQGLQAQFFSREGVVKAVNGVNFSLRQGSILGVMGESGAGKSTLALAILNLLPYPGRITAGRVLFQGQDITGIKGEELRRIRGNEISIIFQDPVEGLNPVLPVGLQVEEIITSHLSIPKKEAKRQVVTILRQIGLPDPQGIASRYPFELSGGMCQRVMIAIATVLNPRVLIADEPTANLDVTVQAGILHELEQLRERQGTAILLISHDLGVVARMAEEVVVMYAGYLVETGRTADIFHRPYHPYTWALMSSLPRLDRPQHPLPYVRGNPPDLTALSDKCPFLERCPKALVECRTEPMPPLEEIDQGHSVACYNPVFHRDDEDDEEW